MQTTKHPTGLPIAIGTAASDYVTLVQQAINKVTGFGQLYKQLDRGINVSGKSRSTLTNYSRHLAHLALHYNQLPTELDQEQVLDYLHLQTTMIYLHLARPSASLAFSPMDTLYNKAK